MLPYNTSSRFYSVAKDSSLLKSPKETKVCESRRKSSLDFQKQRRERRTLRAKIHKILTSIPCNCEELEKRNQKISAKEKKLKAAKFNKVREGLGLDSLSFKDISSDDEIDPKGQIYKRPPEVGKPLTPVTALKENLKQSELSMLLEDPLYYIQDQKFKYIVHSLSVNSWEKLLDGNTRSITPLKSFSGFLESKRSKSKSLKNLKEKATQAKKQLNFREKFFRNHKNLEAKLQKIREQQEARKWFLVNEANSKQQLNEAKLRLANNSKSEKLISKRLLFESKREKVKQNIQKARNTEELIKNFNDAILETEKNNIDSLKRTVDQKRISTVKKRLGQWEQRRTLLSEQVSGERDLDHIKQKLEHSQQLKDYYIQDYLEKFRDYQQRRQDRVKHNMLE